MAPTTSSPFALIIDLGAHWWFPIGTYIALRFCVGMSSKGHSPEEVDSLGFNRASLSASK
jgi:hypothetical protein